MRTYLAAASLTLMLSGYAAGADMPAVDTGPARDAGTMHNDAMKLCDRLAGTEREICVKQAAEHQRMAEPPGLGATPGAPGGGIARPPVAEPKQPSR
jgi:hypothetical protein